MLCVIFYILTGYISFSNQYSTRRFTFQTKNRIFIPRCYKQYYQQQNSENINWYWQIIQRKSPVLNVIILTYTSETSVIMPSKTFFCFVYTRYCHFPSYFTERLLWQKEITRSNNIYVWFIGKTILVFKIYSI